MIEALVDELNNIGKRQIDFKTYTSRTKGKSFLQTPTVDDLTNRLDKLFKEQN